MNMLTKYIGASVVLALLTSCNDFLDVQPKGQNTEDQMFTTITGYEDAMFGVYGKLASSNLYGESLSWGLVDRLGQEFGYDNSQDVSYCRQMPSGRTCIAISQMSTTYCDT